MGREGKSLPAHKCNQSNRLDETVRLVPFNCQSHAIEGHQHLLVLPGGVSHPLNLNHWWEGDVALPQDRHHPNCLNETSRMVSSPLSSSTDERCRWSIAPLSSLLTRQGKLYNCMARMCRTVIHLPSLSSQKTRRGGNSISTLQSGRMPD